jgi:hypothetical protein
MMNRYNIDLTSTGQNLTSQVVNTTVDLIQATSTSNAQLIGTASSTQGTAGYNGAIWLLKWAANTTYHSSTTNFGLADRIFFGSSASQNSLTNSGIQLLRNCIDHLLRGNITVSPSSIDVEIGGGFNRSFTITLSSAPRRPVVLRLQPPSSVIIVGGNDITIPAGSTSVNISVSGGSTTSQSASITWSGAYSSDPYWDTAAAGNYHFVASFCATH